MSNNGGAVRAGAQGGRPRTPLSLEQPHRDLALHMDRSYLRNRGQLLRLVWLFRAASGLLTIEVVAWVVDLVVEA